MEICVSACRYVLTFKYECPRITEALDFSGIVGYRDYCGPPDLGDGNQTLALGRAASILNH